MNCDFSSETGQKEEKQTSWIVVIRKVFFLLLTIVVVLKIPFFIQYPINVWFRDTFQHGGIILKPGLRVLSTLVCYIVNVTIGWLLLRLSGIDKRWLMILYFVLTFLWTVFSAMLIEVAFTD